MREADDVEGGSEGKEEKISSKLECGYGGANGRKRKRRRRFR